MLKNLTYQRKFQLLIACSALAFILIYLTTLSKTIDVYKKNKSLSAKLTEASAAPAQFQVLSKKLSSLDAMIQSRQADTSANVHDIILSFLGNYCKQSNSVLKSFPETFSSAEGEFEIQTHTFSVQGNFISLLKLVYALEQKVRAGKVSSVSFQSSRDPETKRNILISTVYLQNIK